MAAPLSILKLNPDRLGDYLDYFDHDAFADNPSWAFCYCNFLFADHEAKPWGEYTAEENRDAVIKLIGASQLRGYLAYVDEKPVAWCNAAPRVLIPALRNEPDAQDASIGSIVCFVVAKPFRGQGIASQLLAAACESFRQDGLCIAEAYPRKEFRSESSSHFGPLAMYLAAGFSEHRLKGKSRIVVRKQLV